MEVAARTHELSVLDTTGDTKTIWNPDNDVEVGVARAAFDTLKRKGYLIYHVKGDGEKGQAMHSFDPHAAKLIAVPPIQGG